MIQVQSEERPKFLPASHEASAVGMIGGRTDGVGASGGCLPKKKKKKT